MNRVIKKFTTTTIAAMLMIGLVTPAGQVQAATAAELQAMISALMAQIAGQQSVGTQTSVGVPVGKSGGVAGKFASFIQADSGLMVGSTGELLTGKVKPTRYDRNLNKVVMYVSPGAFNDVEEPWVAFDDVELVVNGYGVRSIDVDEPTQWTKVSTQNGTMVYAVTVYEGNIKLPAKSAHTFGARVEISQAGSGDTWKMWIPKNGITTWSNVTSHVSYGPSRGFEYEMIVEDNTDAAALVQLLGTNTEVVKTEGSGSYGKFTFELEVTANDTDLYLPTASNGLVYVDRPMSDDSFLNFSINDGSGKVLDGYGLEGFAVSIDSTARNIGTGGAVAYLIQEGDTEEFTITVTYQPKVTGAYRVSLEGPLRFSPDAIFHDANDATVNFDEKHFRSDMVYLMATSAVKYEVNLYSPVEAQTYKTGDSIVMEWKTANLNDQFANITLAGNNIERHIVKGVPLSKGTVTYKIPVSDTLGKITDGSYKLSIWVTGVKDGDVKAVSDSVNIKIANGTVVNPVVIPVINSFAANPTMVTDGQKVTFTWNAKNSDVCYITLPETPAGTALFGLQGSSGTVTYVPEWKSGVTRLSYTLTCVDDVSKSTPTKVQSTVVVSQLTTPTPTTTPVVTPKPTDCMSGGVAYPDGTRRTIITVDGRTTSIMDGFFLCTTGTWQKQGFPPRVPTSGVSTSTKTTAPVSTSTPKVRGASVDVYSQIATTLMAISVLLEDWQ